ncbi:hypothetical protein B5F09_11800 [Erysipelatoclostridium sp. An173]|uniref:O-antigen ligase family protein n=1 Tax=Erysipelatoclostridium sp. An173 TaxID=1965571 RepID=UPI000B38254D|nr:O-antigen ligase family protein [Erysipelatoclostridium sp. An173]OUP73203.1 hypothetical protein B5F09_11800 [Erysipelatoclostridium sp. An173]
MVFNRKYFKLCFIIYMFINTLALGYLGIEINYLFIPLLIWAVVIIIHDIYKKEFRLTKNYSILMIIQGLILLLATIVNEYSDLNSYVIAIMQLVIYLVIFNNPLSMTKEQIGQEVKVITVLVNILVGVASTISIGMYLAHFSSLANGWKLGVSAGRLSGIYFNSNPAAFLACMTIVLALIAIREKFKGRFWYFLNIFIQFIYILLTKCRMALIILIVIIIMVGYYFFIRRRPYSNLKRILMVSGLVVVIAGTGLIGQQLVEVIPSVGNITRHETSRFQMDQLIEAGQLIVSGDSEKFNQGLEIIDEVSNGRISLTKTALEIWHSEPVIGIGANNFKKIGSQETDVLDYWAIQVVHSHNVFLEALVATGIIGFIIFVIFFVKSVMMVFNVLKKSQGTSMYFIVQMFTMIVLCEFIGGLTDYGVFYIYSLSATLAWCFLGYLYTYQRIIKKEENQ